MILCAWYYVKFGIKREFKIPSESIFFKGFLKNHQPSIMVNSLLRVYRKFVRRKYRILKVTKPHSCLFRRSLTWTCSCLPLKGSFLGNVPSRFITKAQYKQSQIKSFRTFTKLSARVVFEYTQRSKRGVECQRAEPFVCFSFDPRWLERGSSLAMVLLFVWLIFAHTWRREGTLTRLSKIID